ncbi:hypothetical protein [Pilimelia columellifera]|uniref:Resolvase HTH domain-containing protein n=1 Tax=Pilimelia columellifera subsp. columellifera TaxID=706583 RepID=A0ABP6AJB8_9ACTN
MTSFSPGQIQEIEGRFQRGATGGYEPTSAAVAVTDDVLAIAQARQARGESVTTIARLLRIGRSTLYGALQPDNGTASPVPQPRAAG